METFSLMLCPDEAARMCDRKRWLFTCSPIFFRLVLLQAGVTNLKQQLLGECSLYQPEEGATMKIGDASRYINLIFG